MSLRHKFCMDNPLTVKKADEHGFNFWLAPSHVYPEDTDRTLTRNVNSQNTRCHSPDDCNAIGHKNQNYNSGICDVTSSPIWVPVVHEWYKNVGCQQVKDEKQETAWHWRLQSSYRVQSPKRLVSENQLHTQLNAVQFWSLPFEWRDFPRLSRPALRPTQPPIQWVPGFSRG